jgi:putative flippase GtrA
MENQDSPQKKIFSQYANILLNSQPVRYLINGLAATAIHFLVLTFNLKVLGWTSAGLANLVAALFGITASFLGGRYFVFQHSAQSLFAQVSRFIPLYMILALFHGVVMYIWADVYSLHYALGFFIATFIQMVLSYLGNKILVFKV